MPSNKLTKHQKDKFFHVICKGVRKLPLFHDEVDKNRLLTSILIKQFNTPGNFSSISKTDAFYDAPRLIPKIIEGHRLIKIIDFNFLDNHLHLLLKCLRKDGLSSFMKRINTSHANWYNFKYKTVGHVFQTSYFQKEIDNSLYFDMASNYIQYNHKNFYNLTEETEINTYQFSSLYDRLHGNRWTGLLELNERINDSLSD